MKTQLLFLSSIILMAGCQKELTQERQQQVVTKEQAEINQDDTITFNPFPPGLMDDNGSGKVVCLLVQFKVNKDTGYAKEFIISVHHSAGTNLNDAVLYIDGARAKHADIVNDSLDFFFIVPRPLLPENEDYLGMHELALRIRGTDVFNEYYFPVLTDAKILDKSQQDTLTQYNQINMPVQGDTCVYK